jgi:hypothetical protein
MSAQCAWHPATGAHEPGLTEFPCKLLSSEDVSHPSPLHLNDRPTSCSWALR